MYLDQLIFLIGLCSLLAMWPVFALLKPNYRTQAIIILWLICSYFYVYLFGLNQYREMRYQKALDSHQQQSQCAEFIRLVKFNWGRKSSHETAVQFRMDEYQFIEFNADPPALKHLPQMAQLQHSKRYCFRYAGDIKDWNGRWMMTALQADQQNTSMPH